MADRIRMLFGIVGRNGPGMRQVVRFGDRSTGRGTFGGEFGACHCNQWGLYGIRVQQRRNAALFLNFFGQTCCVHVHCTGSYMVVRLLFVNSVRAQIFFISVSCVLSKCAALSGILQRGQGFWEVSPWDGVWGCAPPQKIFHFFE